MYKIKINRKKNTFKVTRIQRRVIVRGKTKRGLPGKGIPTGGATGQILAKHSGADYDTEWRDEQAALVKSVNGQIGDVVLTKSDMGLGNVDNTSDLNKPVSTATQTALNAKENFIPVGTVPQYWRGDKSWHTLELDALDDVQLSSPVDGQILFYRGDSQKWENGDATPLINLFTTDDLAEGSSNLYFTEQRVLDVVEPITNLKANDNEVVHLAGGETITGNKNFFAGLSVDGGAGASTAISSGSVISTSGLPTLILTTTQGSGKTWTIGAAYNDPTSISIVDGSTQRFIINGNGSITVSGQIKNVTDPTAAQDAATMNYVDVSLANLVDAAPGTLDTLNELAAALGDDPNFATTVTNSIAGKQPLNAILTSLSALSTTGTGFLGYRSSDGASYRRTITGTANQVIVTNGDGSLGNPTLGLPQDIHTGATPAFAGANLTGLTTLKGVNTNQILSLRISDNTEVMNVDQFGTLLARQVRPITTNSYSLGSTALYWQNVYTLGVTMPQSSTGIYLYNTSDQTTNYERARMSWSANAFSIVSEAGGTGAVRNISFVSGSQTFTIAQGGTSKFSFTSTIGSTTDSIVGVGGTLNGTSLITSGVKISPSISQSGTAGYTALLINPTETTTGSGVKLLADMQVGSASKFSVDNTGLATVANGLVSAFIAPSIDSGTAFQIRKANQSTSIFSVDTTNNRVGILTTAPTHTETHGSNSTGIVIYNTADQTSIWERLNILNSGNVSYIHTSANVAGGATMRALRLGASDGTGLPTNYMEFNRLSANGLMNLVVGSYGGLAQFTVTGTQTGTSTSQYTMRLMPTISGGGTNSNTDLLINRTETAVGSGAQYLIDAQVGSVSKFLVTNTGAVTAKGTLDLTGTPSTNVAVFRKSDAAAVLTIDQFGNAVFNQKVGAGGVAVAALSTKALSTNTDALYVQGIGTFTGNYINVITSGAATVMTLDSTGTLNSGAHVPLTTATYNLGSGSLRWGTLFAGTVNLANASAISLSEGSNLVAGTTTGTKIGTATTQKLGFYNATPIVQPSLATDFTYSVTNGTTDRTFDADSVTMDELADLIYTQGVDLVAIKTVLKNLGLLA